MVFDRRRCACVVPSCLSIAPRTDSSCTDIESSNAQNRHEVEDKVRECRISCIDHIEIVLLLLLLSSLLKKLKFVVVVARNRRRRSSIEADVVLIFRVVVNVQLA